MSQKSSSPPESSSADVATSPQESTDGHAANGISVATRSAKNGSHQYSLSESDLTTDDRTNEDIFETDISEEVYEQNYQYGTDDRVPDTWYRNARAMASVEDDIELWTRRFYQLLSGKGLDTGPFPFTPGGRIFANAGTGLGKATLINCLAGETLVLTDQGRTPIEELAGSTATLLTRNGKWVEAPVKSYGEQSLRRVTLSRNGQERVIYATPNHRWYVGTKATSGYEVVETDDLQSHHRLERVHSRRHTSVSPSPVGIARGFTFGDGSLVSTSPGAAANVNLVGEKDESLENYFAPFARSEGRPAGRPCSTGVARYRGLPDAWKTTPIDLGENSATLYGWAAGYFAADGCVSESGEVIMDSCTRKHVEHFIDVIEVLGIDHYGLKTQERTSNLTGEDSTRYYVRLNPQSLREEFFVLDEHRIRFNEHGDRSLTYHWKVESVEETDRYETVYCAEVPEERAFALDNGILTGNCFVSGFQGYDQDSMDEIQAELTRQAKILASEGGYGFCAHVMRPRGARIGGVGSMTPGAVQMLDVWNKQAATIVAGSGMKSDRADVKDKIRKGAQMVTMGIWHPDVIEFIEAKQEPGRLHKFNMSVLVTDAFMEAVKNDEKWALRFPDYENEKKFYKEHWDGNLKAYQEKGGTVKTWRDPATGEKAVYDAREIWDKIMKSTYERNEPGVIFVDTINRENNLNYVEHINATNPCVTGDTWVMTSAGPRQVRQLLDEPFEAVVDGESYPATNFFQTGTKEVLRLETKEGYELRLTKDHEVRVATDVSRYSIEKEWREAQNLEPGDEVILHNHRDAASWSGAGDDEEGYLAGLFVGDSSVGFNGPVLSVWEDGHSASVRDEVKKCVRPMDKRSDFSGWHSIDERNEHRLRLAAIDRMLERFDLTDKSIGLKVEEASSEFYRGFLKGFFDADGSVQGSQTKGVSVRLAQSDLDRLKAVQRMLHRLGIASTIYQNRREEGERELPNGKGGTDLYSIQAQHELVISNDNLQQFADRVGFAHDGKQDRLDTALDSYDRAMNRERFVATVQSVEQDGTEPVYDTTVEEVHSFDANGVYVHNCGEQVLPVGGVCLLGNLNVTQLVDREAGEIDYDLLDDLVPLAVRFLDNVNDLSYVPLQEQQRNLQEKRRIGLGHYGDGSALMMMKKRYGSDEGARVMREFQEHLANQAYQASARLADEKGAFPLFDKDEYLSSPFVQRLSDKTKEMIGDLGLRNSHLLSIQPTGNTSTLGNAPSSGIEPVFMHSYIRTSEQPALPEGINRPSMSPTAYEVGQDIDANGTAWVAEEQGDETVLRCQEDDHTHWQIHPTRGICKDQEVKDYAVRHMEDDGTWDPEAEWAVTTRDLDVDDHLTQMKALAPFVDSSMSKTVNVPNDYPFKDFKELYKKAHATGVIKGVTTYRAGTMSAVLSGDDADEEDGVPRTEAPDRPDTLPCAIHRVRYRGDHWTILVGFLNDDPYEVFAFQSEGETPLFDDYSDRIDEGYIRKNDSRHYSLLGPDGEVVIDDITSHMPSDGVREETRLVSTALRHGSKIGFLVEQLEKAEGSIASFGQSMAKALRAHATDHEVTCDKCGSSSVRHVEGCMECADCGHSRCS